MRKRFTISAVLAVAVVAAGFAAWFIRDDHKPVLAAPAPIPVPVVAKLVAASDVPIYLRGVGTVIAYNNVLVRSQITGQIVKIAFTQGQTVKKGDPLAEIDPAPYQAVLDQATANRDRDQAQLVNAQANLNRYTPLAEKGYATAQLVDTQKAQLAQLQAAVKADEAIIEQARVNLAYTRLTSPIDGVTGIRQIDEGNIIHPTDPNGLVDVAEIEPISLIFSLPQTDFARIQPLMAKGTLTVLAYSQDNTTLLDSGTLELIDNQIVQTTGTIRLRAKFPNAKHQLWPGELVNALLQIEIRKNASTIGASAIQQGPQGAYVYVIGAGNKVELRPVKVAQISQGQALIDSGLKPGENVVIDGQYKLDAGLTVRELHGKAAQEADLQSAVEQAIP